MIGLTPIGVPNRVNGLEKTAIVLKNNSDIVTQVTGKTIDNQEVMAKAIEEAVEKLQELAKDFPRFVWISSVLVNRMVTSGQHLQRVANEAKRGRIDIDSIAYLLELPVLSYDEKEETKLYSIKRVTDSIVNLDFSINVRAPDAHAYSVYGFSHWNNLSETLEYVEYR